LPATRIANGTKCGCAVSRKPVGSQSILVVDNHDSIAESMASVMRYEGYTVRVARSGQAGLNLANEMAFDLVVADVALADLHGRGLARRLHANGADIPFLYLASKDEVRGSVAEVKINVDNYLLRPFSMMELIARIRVMFPRRGGDDFRIRFADLIINEHSHEVWRADRLVHLSETEFDLLLLFLLHPRQVLSKDRIVDHAWRYNFAGSRSIVETYVFYLRKKLDAHGPPLIHTIRHVGYIMREAS